MRQRRAVLLDFDHTLFDTDRFFWVDLRKTIACFGIEEKAWEEAYEAVWPRGYSLERHLAALMKRKAGRRPSKEAILSALRDAFSNLRGYLYQDAVPFLERASKEGFDLYLLSFGDPSWQAYKVKASGVAPYFQEVFSTKREQRKVEAVGGIAARYETIHAIDNDPRELDLMKTSYPQLLTHWIRRVPSEAVTIDDPETRYRFREARRYVGLPSQYPHHHVTTLAEVVL